MIRYYLNYFHPRSFGLGKFHSDWWWETYENRLVIMLMPV
jgi:hypothetical protein